jgi:malonyl-CoA/methylmalonyl-CoA synthetase
MTYNLFTAFRRTFHKPSRIFLERPDGTTLRHGDLLDLSGRVAKVLVELGVRPDDRVAAQVEKSAEALMLYLGTLRAGAIYLPQHGLYSGRNPLLSRRCRTGAVRLPAGAARVAGGYPRRTRRSQGRTLGERQDGSLMQRVFAAAPRFEDVLRGADDLAAIVYTSGTTGRSKGAMLTHRNLASNAQALAETWRFTADDRLLHALPIFHSHGLFVATNVGLSVGASLILLPRFDADEIIRLLPTATAMMGVPTFYTRLLARPDFTRERVAHMRLFVSGSAPLSAETHREFRERTGHAILERYGMTETNMNTSNPYDGPRIAGSVGLPLPGVEIRVAEPRTGHPLPQGEIGVIEIRGPNVCKGYWRMPEKTKAEFREDGFFVSGDLGFIDKKGYVHIVGRDKDLIISGGFCLSEGSGGGDRGTAGRCRRGRHRRAEPRLRRGRGRRRRAAGGGPPRRTADANGARRRARQVQTPEADLLCRGAAAQRLGQGAEERTAQAA